MIMTVSELRQYIDTDETDLVLEAKLHAIELAIRAHTNNNFINRGFGIEADVMAGVFMSESLIPFGIGDTVMISNSDFMQDCLCTVKEVDGDTTFTVNEHVADEDNISVYKVIYPMDVKLGVVNMLKWDMNNRDKVGVSSETISRHSVTYFDQTGANTVMGFPVSLIGFLKPYKKARFGRGIGV